MKKHLVFLISLAVIFLTTTVTTLTSCKKNSTPNANAAFAGTYPGKSNFGNTPSNDTVIITPDSAANAINILVKVEGTNYSATVSGDSIYIPAQQTTLNGVSINITGGSGTLAGDTALILYSTTGPISFSFQGSKN